MNTIIEKRRKWLNSLVEYGVPGMKWGTRGPKRFKTLGDWAGFGTKPKTRKRMLPGYAKYLGKTL